MQEEMERLLGSKCVILKKREAYFFAGQEVSSDNAGKDRLIELVEKVKNGSRCYLACPCTFQFFF